jgi:hypothetical protein
MQVKSFALDVSLMPIYLGIKMEVCLLTGFINMGLSYAKYIDLMTALDEHCKGTLERDELQNAIFNHYVGMNRTFVAENMKGSKRLFSSYLQSRTQTKRERKAFRKFMDEGSVEQSTTEDNVSV